MALGGTVTELQKRMSKREVELWVAYRTKNGPMGDVRRFDRPAALLASLMSHAHGGKAEPADFLPYGKKQVEDKVATLEDIIKGIGGVKHGKRR